MIKVCTSNRWDRLKAQYGIAAVRVPHEMPDGCFATSDSLGIPPLSFDSGQGPCLCHLENPGIEPGPQDDFLHEADPLFPVLFHDRKFDD